MTKKRNPSFWVSAAVFLSIMIILICGILIFKAEIHSLLLLALILTCIVGFTYGFTFDEMLEGMKLSISRAMGALCIFILIGIIIATWIQCGTVPALIYYGLKFINVKYFLPMGLIICSITSLGTGTSWGTVGTVGLALMGMGVSIGIPAPLVAGMIVSGAFFGDKMSPLSDTTNLSAVSAGSDLYDHIKTMCYTTVPAYIISLILYTILGFRYANTGNVNVEQITQIKEVLSATFNLNPIVLIPIIVVLVFSIMKVPSIPAMVIGSLLGSLIAIIFQGVSFSDALTVMNLGYTSATGIEIIDNLLIRGGIQKMMWTFSLSFIALCLGGVLEKLGFLATLINRLLSKIRRTGSLFTMVIFTSILSNIAMGEIYLAIILNGSLYRDIFEEKGFDNSMLSRLLEEGGTMTGALIPWTTAGAFVAVTLGVPTFEYFQYSFLNIINPLLSIILSYMGIFVFLKNKNKNKTSC